MIITKVETFLVNAGHRNWVFTEIHTDEGVTGISEVTIRRKALTLESSIKELARYLVGKDPTCIEDNWEKMYRDAFWVGGAMLSTAISAVEVAMWDILGKSVGLPIYKLLGGPTRDRIRVYAHVGRPEENTPQAFAQAALRTVERGYTALKTGPFPGGGYGPYVKETEGLPSSLIHSSREYLGTVRDAVGWGIDLAIDCHGRLSPTNAIRLAQALADLDLLFLEEPVPPENVDALAWVAARSPVPIATGERLYTKYGVREVLEKRAAAILQPDVCNVGGIMEAKKVAAMAEAYYVSIAPHNPNGPVATAMAAHLAASIPNFLILETSGQPEELARQAEVVRKPLQLEDGHLRLPTGPGLGIELNKEAFARHPYQVCEGTR